MIELLLVIAIIGILSVFALPKWTATTMNVNYTARQILNDIRYAQGLSMTTGLRYRWVRLSATSYSIQNEAGTAITLPSGATTMTITGGASMGTLTNLPNSLIAFSSIGAPYTTSTIPGTALAAVATIPVTGGGTTRTIQISPGTGYGVLV